ncbi:MAG TPA: hypothetical protein VJU86_00415 [Pyrinomonadaceae bacterium]|nr:hypothetical protein [Pyrinomonadaceae bacterium]
MKNIVFWSRTILIVCLVIAPSITVFGQRRVAIPKRTAPPPPAPSTSTPTSTSTSTSTPTAAGPVVEQPASVAQTYKPALEYQYLMELRFYENQGGFLVENLEVVFPPAGNKKATFVVSRAGGEVVASVPLRLETPLASYTMFGMYVPDGVPGTASVGEPGDYVLSVQVDGQPITTMPFSMKREASSDPFNPKTTFVREGPWRDLAHFSVRTDEPDSHVEFSWWTSLRELPAGTKNPLVTLHILHGGQEIAATRSPVVPTQTDWQFLRHEFHFPAEKQVRWMTMADLTKRDGEYTVVAKVNGTPFKSYRAEVKGGQLQRHPRNAMDMQPHTSFISPRQVDTSSRTSSRYSMRDLYWVTKK